jgi:hypothetical protein
MLNVKILLLKLKNVKMSKRFFFCLCFELWILLKCEYKVMFIRIIIVALHSLCLVASGIIYHITLNIGHIFYTFFPH